MNDERKAAVWLLVGIPAFPIVWAYKRAEQEITEDDDND